MRIRYWLQSRLYLLSGEYPYVVEILNTAIQQAKEKGVLGISTLKSVWVPELMYVEKRVLLLNPLKDIGRTTFQTPFPPVIGLWGKPTIVNNVETFANIPVILEKGADWYAGIGSKSYPGTKLMT